MLRPGIVKGGLVFKCTAQVIPRRGLHQIFSSRPKALRLLQKGLGRRYSHDEPADQPGFTSILDNPPRLVRSGVKHGPGLIILGQTSTQGRLMKGPRANSLSSSHARHSIRSGDMADISIAMEDGPHHEIRRPTPQTSFATSTPPRS